MVCKSIVLGEQEQAQSQTRFIAIRRDPILLGPLLQRRHLFLYLHILLISEPRNKMTLTPISLLITRIIDGYAILYTVQYHLQGPQWTDSQFPPSSSICQ